MILNFLHCAAGIVHFEDFQNNWSCDGISLIMLLLVNQIAKGWCTAVIFALEGIFCMAADDLHRKLRRVVFSHTFQHRLQNDPFRTICNILFCRKYTDAVFLQRSFVMCTVIAVAGKAVEFPDNDHIKQTLGAIFDHLLKVRSIIGFRREGAINIMANHRDSISFTILRTFTDLTLDGFLALSVA